MNNYRLATALMVHDDSVYLLESIRSLGDAVAPLVFLSSKPWHGKTGDWHAAADIVLVAGAQAVQGEWSSELEHRQAAREWLVEHGFTYALIPDGDEIIEPRLLETLVKIAEAGIADRVYVHWDTYWKSPEYVIRPRERFTPCIMYDLRVAEPVGLRNYEGGRPLLLGPEHGIIHHLSYAGPDSRIKRKIETWGHANEVVPGWYENTWLGWDSNKMMRNLHPTHPSAYGHAERIKVPSILKPAMERYLELAGEQPRTRTRTRTRTTRPTVSVVIPLHGGSDDIRQCLESLDSCAELLHEVIVVDNASPDDAADVAGAILESSSSVVKKLVRNETNEGFAKACNKGLSECTSDVVIFLNSDTVVPKAGFERLIEAVTRSGSIAAAGPYTNYAAHGQAIEPTYTSLDTLDLFAEDFAERDADDEDVDMLVGFCLAVRRSVMEEIGGFDERFGLGMFEDNDLCYRMRRAGYRLVRAARSYVHHHGSRTLARMAEGPSTRTTTSTSTIFDPQRLLDENYRKFLDKWSQDLEFGYASHLSGLKPDRIVFAPDKHPDVQRKRVAELARRADISLCMIVRNEERVLADCLRSAQPFFKEMIVVDTGSKDRTLEIAREFGAKVFEIPWPDHFAAARNESLRHAKGKWIFWMDADDTLPWQSGEAILNAALSAPPEVTGYIIPVQFVENATFTDATRVDHVKLFRNYPDAAFEGRIHEQILPYLNTRRGHVARLADALVLHSGYDNSPEGQARKRKRDYRLLRLDLKDRPNHPFVLFNFGMTDHYCGDHKSAIRWLKKCLKFAVEGDTIVRKAYAMMALSYKHLGDMDACRKTIERGLEIVPDDPELRFHLANLHSEQGRLPEAREEYLKVAGADITGHFSSVDMGILGYKSFYSLANVCLAMGNYVEAKDWFQKALDPTPRLPIIEAFFRAALENGDLVTARGLVEQVFALEGNLGTLLAASTLGAAYAEQVGGPANAEEFLRTAIARNPHVVGPRLVLVRRLLPAGRDQEAYEHLMFLNNAGVAEAAFFIGGLAAMRGEFAEALSWMERADALNPGHPETLAKIAEYRQQTGGMSLDEALAKIAEDLEVDAGLLSKFAAEDEIGGYGSAANPWPGGSVWDVEGKVLYALVRARKPKTIVEVGSMVGCSTSHLAAASKKNRRGVVHAVDPALDFSRVDPSLKPFIKPVKKDVFDWEPPANIDFVFEDGSHEPGFTRHVFDHLRQGLSRQAVVLCHDYCHAQLGGHVSNEFDHSAGSTARGILVAPSNCGLGYAIIHH